MTLAATAACAASGAAAGARPPAECGPAGPPQGGAAPRIPASPATPPGSAAGTVLGAVADSATGRAVATGGAYLSAPDSGRAAPAPLTVAGRRLVAALDSAGGFVLRDVPPGRYTLVAYGFAYRRRTAALEVRAGAVDSVRVRLPYCAPVVTGRVQGGRTAHPGRSSNETLQPTAALVAAPAAPRF